LISTFHPDQHYTITTEKLDINHPDQYYTITKEKVDINHPDQYLLNNEERPECIPCNSNFSLKHVLIDFVYILVKIGAT
jgi:hypothetical protein